MLLHVQDALQQGHKKILLRTVDTGVLALAVAFLQQVTEGEHLDLWVAFGTGNNFRYIATHEIATKLGPEVSKALHVFHAFTGCDTVSCFGDRGKKTALEAWKSYPDVTDAFLALAHKPLFKVFFLPSIVFVQVLTFILLQIRMIVLHNSSFSLAFM